MHREFLTPHCFLWFELVKDGEIPLVVEEVDLEAALGDAQIPVHLIQIPAVKLLIHSSKIKCNLIHVPYVQEVVTRFI